MKRWLMSLLVLVTLSSCGRQTEEQENVLGYMGLARKNPFLAAERYLEADGHEVSSSTGVLMLDESESTVFAPASSIRSIAEAERILAWVTEGGHFVCFLERADNFWRDVGDHTDHDPSYWREDITEDEPTLSPGVLELFEELDLELVILEDDASGHPTSETAEDENDSSEEQESEEADKAKQRAIAVGESLPNAQLVTVQVEDDLDFQALLGGAMGMIASEGYYDGDWTDDREDGHRFISRLYGYTDYDDADLGRITFISDARLFRNPYLGMEQHAELLDMLATRDGEVVFSLGKVRSFTSMLGEHASKAMWALLVLLVLWLWKNLPRFGPILDVENGHSRNHIKHVGEVGRFFWRHQRSDILLQSLQDAVMRKSGHAFAAEVDHRVLEEQLAQMVGVEPEAVHEAMHAKQVKDANDMVRITRTLQNLLKQL